MSDVTRAEFASEILGRLDLPESKRNLIVMVTWAAAEGGNARWNPYNTTLRGPAYPGSTDYNFVHVQNYVSREQGIQAFLDTIREPGKGYEKIIAHLRRSAWPSWTLRAIYRSQWGTRKLPFLLSSVKRAYPFYAGQTIAG